MAMCESSRVEPGDDSEIKFPKTKAVIASVSEAIHRAARKQARMDCFVARAPRNDGEAWE